MQAVDLPERLSRIIRFFPCFRLMLRRYLWTGAGPWSSGPVVETCCEEPIHMCILWQHVLCRTWMNWHSLASTHRVFQRIYYALVEEIALFTGHLHRKKGLCWHFMEHLHANCKFTADETSILGTRIKCPKKAVEITSICKIIICHNCFCLFSFYTN